MLWKINKMFDKVRIEIEHTEIGLGEVSINTKRDVFCIIREVIEMRVKWEVLVNIQRNIEQQLNG